MAAEFCFIFEEHPEALLESSEEGAAEMHLMIMQMGIDPILFLPQIPMSQWEQMMDQFHQYVKQYHVGLRTYWYQMARFWQYVDREKAYEYFQRFWETEPDDLSDCPACECSYGVQMSLMMGDRAAADEFARPMEEGHIEFCSDTPQLYWLAYLEDALNRRDLKEAEKRANALYRKGNRDKSDLSYLGAILRCWAYTDLNRAIRLLTKRLEWTIGMWDQKKVYDFYKGAWVCFHMLSNQQNEIHLELPQAFPLWRQDGEYAVGELAAWFQTQAESIGRRFDTRNGSRYFAQDLSMALVNA